MADSDHTLESLSSLENSPPIINLIVDEIFVAAPKGIGSLAMEVILREYEPSILLQGEWLRVMGFEKGQNIQVFAKNKFLIVKCVDETANASDELSVDKDQVSLFKDFVDELDAIKECLDDSQYVAWRDWNGRPNESSQGCETGSEHGDEIVQGKVERKGSNKDEENGCTSGDKSKVLADVDGGINRG